MATKKTDEDPTDAAAQGDTPIAPELARMLEENHNLRQEVNRLKEENDALRHRGTPAPDDDGGGKSDKK